MGGDDRIARMKAMAERERLRVAAILKRDRPAPKAASKRGKRRPLPVLVQATPERVAKSGGSFDMVPTVEKAGERTLLTRRFADTHVERARRTGRLNHAQWYAADWYETTYAAAGITGRVTAQYDITIAGAGGTSYGMPRTEAEAWARESVRQARAVMVPYALSLVEALVFEDWMPEMAGGVQRDRYWERIGRCLDALAAWLKAPGS